MVNLRELTITTQKGRRNLYLSPLLLQSNEIPVLDKPARAYVYENLIMIDFYECIGKHPDWIPSEPKKIEPVVKFDQDFSKAYIGYLEVVPGKKVIWQWMSGCGDLNQEEIAELERLVKTLR